MLLLLSHFSRVRLCATPQTAAHQAPPPLGFSRQEHWRGLPFLQCMKVKSESEVTQSCPTLHDSMDCGPPGSSTMEFSRQEYWSGVPSLITKLLLFGLFRFPLFLHFSPFPDQTYFLTQVFPQTEGRLRTWGGAVRSYRILLHSLSESQILLVNILFMTNVPLSASRWWWRADIHSFTV